MRNVLRDRHELVIGTRRTEKPKFVCTLKEWSKDRGGGVLLKMACKERFPFVNGVPFSGFRLNERVGILLVVVYLTIIPRARMGSESIAHEAKGRMGY